MIIVKVEIIGKYKDLELEVKRIHKAWKMSVVPFLSGAFGTIWRSVIFWPSNCLESIQMAATFSIYILYNETALH